MGLFDIILKDLKTLFEVRVYVAGKIDIQKSLYFMKEFGYIVPFNYRWVKFGPYSQELAITIDRLTQQGYLKYTGRYDIDERHFRYVKPESTPRLEQFFLGLEKICNKNNFDKVDFIECAASLHFIFKSIQIKKKEDVFERLDSLKPYRSEAFEPLKEKAWSFLKEQKLLA